MNVSFRESEPYYSEGFSTTSIQGENFSEEYKLHEESRNELHECSRDEFLKLEEITERLRKNNIHEELSINIELPLLIPFNRRINSKCKTTSGTQKEFQRLPFRGRILVKEISCMKGAEMSYMNVVEINQLSHLINLLFLLKT